MQGDCAVMASRCWNPGPASRSHLVNTAVVVDIQLCYNSTDCDSGPQQALSWAEHVVTH